MTLIAYRGRCPTCGRDDGHDPFATPAAQPAPDGGGQLPELPEQVMLGMHVAGRFATYGYTASQMRAYGRQCRSARVGEAKDAARYRWLRDPKNTDAEAELLALRTDAARLDWLAREWEKNGSVDFTTMRPRQPAICNLFTVTTQHIKARGFREVIDVALATTGGAE